MGGRVRDPFAKPPAPPAPDPSVAILAALDQLRAAVEGLRTAPVPAPVVEVAPPDLSDLVMAVQGLKGPATAEDIAEALAAVLRRDPEPASAPDVMGEIVDALKRLDFRLKGGGGNMMGTGGGSVEFSPKGLTQLTNALTANTPDESGTWGYTAGTNGTVALSGSKRVLSVTATALGAAGSFTINGGDTITLPYDSTDKASSSLTVTPRGNLVDPTLVFAATIDAYFIEYVV